MAQLRTDFRVCRHQIFGFLCTGYAGLSFASTRNNVFRISAIDTRCAPLSTLVGSASTRSEPRCGKCLAAGYARSVEDDMTTF
jgi:hypothetical protein